MKRLRLTIDTILTKKDLVELTRWRDECEVDGFRLWTSGAHQRSENEWQNTILLYSGRWLKFEYEVMTDYKPTAENYYATRFYLNRIFKEDS